MRESVNTGTSQIPESLTPNHLHFGNENLHNLLGTLQHKAMRFGLPAVLGKTIHNLLV